VSAQHGGRVVTGRKHTPIVTFCVDCGACGAELEHPSTQSVVWNPADGGSPTEVECHRCGVTNKIRAAMPRTKGPK
jgi:hypothetical protein